MRRGMRLAEVREMRNNLVAALANHGYSHELNRAPSLMHCQLS